MSKTKKGNPIPTKFDEPEETLILALNELTGLSQGEIIRRAVRLLRMEIAKRGSRTFIFEELGPKPPGEITALKAAEPPAAYGKKPTPSPVRRLSHAAAKFNKAKKQQAAPSKKSAA